jgi:hypothetical protein
MLRRLLLDALVNPDRSDRPHNPDALVSDAARSATEWIGVDADDREKVLRELLKLADALRSNPPREASLPDKVSAVHRNLREAAIPHAIGGALAVGYYGEPRSTLDIDINVFVPVDRWSDLRAALDSLNVDVGIDETDLKGTDEVRLDWDPNSLHLFFSSDPLHERMSEDIRFVPFNGDTIPIVSPEHLVIRKALLDRTKDWLDIEQIFVASSPLDSGEIVSWLEQMAGERDPRIEKLCEVKASLSLD